MKLLREIAEKDNAIFASIHPDSVISNDPYNEDLSESQRPETKDFEQAKVLHSELSHHYDFRHAKYKDMPSAHYPTLKEYTDDSADINGYHWAKHQNSKHFEQDPNCEAQTKHLDAALSVHKTPHDMTVYSGIKHDPRTRKNKEGIVHHPAYLSSSINKIIARNFCSGDQKHVLSINVPKGHPGAYVGHISHVSVEREFILPRGLNLKHVKTETETHKDDNYLIHHMEIA